MSDSELVFNVIDTLSEPFALFEKIEKESWALKYSNKVMQELSKEDTHEDSKTTNANMDILFKPLLKLYEDSSSDSNIFHEIELFNSLYNIHFNKNENNLLITFWEIKPEQIFENITFHDLSGACNAIVVILDSMGKIVDMNECFSDIAGMKREDILQKGFFETFIPGNIETLNSHFSQILKKDVYHQQFVTPFKGAREDLYRINWQVSKIVRNDNSYIISVGSDISKYVEENTDLKRQLTSIKVGFDYFPLAVGYMDYKGVFTKMNPRFMKMFNIPKGDKKIFFDNIAIFKKNIGFEEMNKHIGLIKEMSYKIDFVKDDKPIKLKVDIRLLSGKKETSKLYIVVAQKVD